MCRGFHKLKAWLKQHFRVMEASNAERSSKIELTTSVPPSVRRKASWNMFMPLDNTAMGRDQEKGEVDAAG